MFSMSSMSSAIQMFAKAGPSVGAVGLLAGITALGIYEGVEYEHRKHDEKEVKENEALNDLYDETYGKLKNAESKDIPRFHIKVPGATDSKDKAAEYKSMQMPEKELLAMALRPIIPADPDLKLMGFYLTMVKLYLYIYYYERWHRILGFNGNPNDTTSVFCRTLIYVIDTHFANLQGYQFDLQLMHQTIQIINDYPSSVAGGQDGVDHLAKANKQLQLAQIQLLEHGKNLSWVGKLNDLSLTCRELMNDWMQCLLWLVTDVEDKKYVDLTPLVEAAEGKIKPRFAHGKTWHNGEINIPESPYKADVMNCISDHMAALGLKPKKEETYVPLLKADRVKYPVFTEADKQYHKPSFFSLHPHHEHLAIEPFAEFFAKYKNWVTANPEFTDSMLRDSIVMKSIIDPKELARRSPLIKMFCRQAQMLNVFLVISAMFAYEGKAIGDDYIDNPHHCNFPMEGLSSYEQLTIKHASELEQFIQSMETSAASASFQPPHAKMKQKTVDTLGMIKTKLADKVLALVDYHKKRQPQPNAVGLIDPSKSPLLRMTVHLVQENNLMTAHEIAEAVAEEVKSDSVLPPKVPTSDVYTQTDPMPVPSVALAAVKSDPLAPSSPMDDLVTHITECIQFVKSTHPHAANAEDAQALLVVLKSLVDRAIEQFQATQIIAPETDEKNADQHLGQSSPPPSSLSVAPTVVLFPPANTFAPLPAMEALLKQISDAIVAKQTATSKPADIKAYQDLLAALKNVIAYAVKMRTHIKDADMQKRGEYLYDLSSRLAFLTQRFVSQQTTPEMFETVVAKELNSKKALIDMPEKGSLTSPLQKAGLYYTHDRHLLNLFENQCVDILAISKKGRPVSVNPNKSPVRQ